MTATQLKVRELLGKLITHETGLTEQTDPENFALARKFALKEFKHHAFHRPSQFSVLTRLRGLEEKFRILDREDLADALQVRIDELPQLGGGSDYVPDVLHLLLELSKEPLKHARVEDLEKLVKPEPPHELTWRDIVADEPLEGDIWGDVDFGAESSDAWSDDGGRYDVVEERLWEDETQESGRSKRRKKRKEGGALEEEEREEERYRVAGVEGFRVDSDKDGLERMKEAQYWVRQVVANRGEVDVSLASGQLEDLWVISELQSLREVILMILGYPCALFETGKDHDPSVVWVDSEKADKRFALSHASLKGFVSLLEWFASRGTSLNRIRRFTKAKEDLPERQAFMAAVEEKLAAVDKEVIAIEEKYVGKGPPISVSLLSLQTQLEPLLRPFTILSKIISHEKASPITHSSHLEALYQAACLLQSTGDIPSFHFTATIFFSCLRTYLRPIHAWMESGALPPPSTDFLIVQTQSADEVELGSLWHSQFSLRRTAAGALDAPSFVHPVADRIFTTGKSVVFLRRLHPSSAASSALSTYDDLILSTVLPPTSTATLALAPFSALFIAAFTTWISARQLSISSRLHTHLFTAVPLFSSLSSLATLYFCTNAHLFATLSATVFEKLDQRASTWSDRFLLTELAQSVYSSSRVRMSVVASAAHSRPRPRSIPLLSTIELDYQLPWAVQNIVTPATSLPVYKGVFTFLLQLRRARYLLEHLPLLPSPSPSPQYLSLRHRLLWFTGVIHNHLTHLVLHPLAERLHTEMQAAEDLDAMCACHTRFIARVREQCLLGKKLQPIHAGIISVLSLVVKFAYAQADGGGGGSRTARLEFLPTPRHLRKRPRRGRADSSSSSSGGDEELHSASDAASSTAFDDSNVNADDSDDDMLNGEERYERELKKMGEEFVNLVGFVRDGLRGVARAGVMPHLEMLAEGLEGYGADGGRGWGAGSSGEGIGG